MNVTFYKSSFGVIHRIYERNKNIFLQNNNIKKQTVFFINNYFSLVKLTFEIWPESNLK